MNLRPHTAELDLDTPLEPALDVVAAPVGEGLVLFDLRSGKLFELDAVGARIWNRGGGALHEAYEALLAEYDVDRDVLRNDVLAIAAELLASGLLVESGGPHA